MQNAPISVFVENAAGQALKHHFDEKRGVLRGVSPVSRPYPFAYGFVLNTSAADGDNLDCFVITERALATGDIVECVVLGLMEQWDDGLVDHNVLACPVGEAAALTPSVERTLSEFVTHVFEHVPDKVIRAGRFLGAEVALAHVARCR
jgi:inorganic pyrophosphatase